MLLTAAPSTWPTGSKPTLRIATNSSELSAEPHVPLARISAIRASAEAGSSSLTPLAYYHGGASYHGGINAPNLILRFPLLVSALYCLQRARRGLFGGEGAQPVLARGGSVVVFHGVAGKGVPPSLFVVHAHYTRKAWRQCCNRAGFPPPVRSPRRSRGLSTWARSARRPGNRT